MIIIILLAQIIFRFNNVTLACKWSLVTYSFSLQLDCIAFNYFFVVPIVHKSIVDKVIP